MQFQGKLADLLVERGHEVDVFIANWIPFEKRNGTTKANVMRFDATTYTQYHELDFFKNPFQNNDIKLDMDRETPYFNCTLQFCMDIINHPTLISELRQNNYDIFIGEIFDPCMFFLSNLLSIQTKIISSAISMPDEIAFAHGLPVPRSYVPSVYASSINVPELSWKDRMMNLIIDVYYPMLLSRLTKQIRRLYNTKFNVVMPSYNDILRSSSYIFVNVHDHLDNPRPVTRKIHYIGGISVKKPALKQSPKIEDIFQHSTKGVILFSMGMLNKKIIFLQNKKRLNTKIPVDKIFVVSSFLLFPILKLDYFRHHGRFTPYAVSS
jgi:uncharacterized pyridoxamine 5'-phosphate oxidase family protein